MFCTTAGYGVKYGYIHNHAFIEGEECQLLASAALILEESAPGTRRTEY
jgi:hypothetical protein